MLKFILILVVYQQIFEIASQDPGCYMEGKARVQLMFVLDHSGTFKEFLQHFPAISNKIITQVDEKYPGSEFGITLFSDYSSLVGPIEKLDDSPKNAKCYVPRLPLTKDKETFRKSSSDIEVQITNGDSESSLTAVLFAAANRTVGWHKAEFDSNGFRVHRILVLITDEGNVNHLQKPGNRIDAKGDGTDSCEKSLPAKFSVIDKVLFENGYFQQMPSVPHSSFEFDLNEADAIVKKIVEGLKENTQCMWGDPPGYNTLGL